MNLMRNAVICLIASVLSLPLACAQDLSKYRNFSLGASLTQILKQTDQDPVDATIVQRSPAMIEQLQWWPVQSYQSSTPADPVEELLFSFYNGELYRITATYDSASTQGLTAADLVEAISAKYGMPTGPAVEASPPKVLAYRSTDETIAFWEDSQNSLILSRSPLSDNFELVMFSKRLNGQAEAAIAAASKQQREDAPQREVARAKREADDLATMRQANLKAFRP
jgi:hypothetical protein